MKQIILLLIIISTISCKNNNTDEDKNKFIGLGKLTLGSEFKKIENNEYFELNSDLQRITSDSVYCIAKYEINKEFGIVENLNIAVKNGKIFWISFNDGMYTNDHNIRKFFDSNLYYKEKDENNKYNSDYYYSNNVKAYLGSDGRKSRYSYCNEQILQDIRKTEDSISKVRAIEGAKKMKEEYMKDMK